MKKGKRVRLMKKKNRTELSCCEIRGPKGRSGDKKNRSAFYRHKGDMSWQGVRDEPYKAAAEGWSGIMRRVLIGGRGESAKFHVRYFEIAQGGNSSLERHRHEHVVICVKGRGVVRVGKAKKHMDFMDTIYIAPDTVHQLLNPFKEPFGFLCIVNARRDKPKVLGGSDAS
jgi:quercetin dioxygenase-like cupin family protein